MAPTSAPVLRPFDFGLNGFLNLNLGGFGVGFGVGVDLELDFGIGFPVNGRGLKSGFPVGV